MRNMKALGLLALAIIAGLAAALYAAGWVSERATVASQKVVVAAVDIELGSKINAQMLTMVDWPTGSTPEGAFNDIKDVQDRVLKVGLLRGDAILERKLAPAGTQGGLSAVIAEGKRAMTVRVNDVIGVAGFALPGNYVDVMVNSQVESSKKGEPPSPVSMTVLEQVLVLAVAQEASRDDTKPKVVSAVTLELSPEDAEKLDLARSVGSLSLVLRNQLDKKMASTSGVTKNQLLKLREVADTKVVAASAPKPTPVVARPRPAPTAPAPAKEPSICVEVIRNGTLTANCF
ncbi:Flp pilus assembly protein CpaB [Ramlibacter solisilvae]|uniref:Pilus assembly protein CpaB n=1 Tax=Ramlibacter tataouinensis TaxID=94132 RepID=A0A127JX53_9BURK|nr:Flp pilus assembly protein CpaB [Ramlibacter tataouinensis]AMO24453.1 pilus assembly protein CpaB [Ramlibacter tataouinensis]